MKRNEFYIEVLFAKDSIADVHSAIDQQNWTDQEKADMHKTMKDYLSGNMTIEWEKCVSDYIKDHPMTYQQLVELSDTMNNRLANYEQLYDQAVKEVAQFRDDTPRNTRIHWNNMMDFTGKQEDNIKKFLELAEKERDRLTPKQSMDKVMEILENSKTLDDMKDLIENQELTEDERKHILDYLSSDKENRKDAFKVVLNDIKNAPAYEDVTDWKQQREELAQKVDEIKAAQLENKDLLEKAQAEKEKDDLAYEEITNKLGKAENECRIKNESGVEVSNEELEQLQKLREQAKETYNSMNQHQADIEARSAELDALAYAEMATSLMYAEAKSKAWQQTCQQAFEPAKKRLEKVKEGYDEVNKDLRQIIQTRRQMRQELKNVRSLDRNREKLEEKVYDSWGQKFKMWRAQKNIRNWQKEEHSLNELTNERKKEAGDIIRKQIEKENKKNAFENKMNPNGPQKPIKTEAEIQKEVAERTSTLEKARDVIREANNKAKVPFIGKMLNRKLDRQMKEIAEVTKDRDTYKDRAIPTMKEYVQAVDERQAEIQNLHQEFTQQYNEGQLGHDIDRLSDSWEQMARLEQEKQYMHTFGQDVNDFIEKYKDEIYEIGDR